MPGAVVGSAEFQIAVNIANFNAGFDAAQRQAAAGSAKIQKSIDGNLKKAEQSAARFGESFKKAMEIGGAVTGVTVGLAAVHAGLQKVFEQTQKQAQAQFALNKVYGEGAAQYRAFSQAQAQATGRSAVDFQKASVQAATLAKNYGLTADQIQTLIARSADLAAVHGKEVTDAAERVIAALRGEGEAAEALGLTLNSDAVKAFANMTDEQRKNFETLDQVTKAQIIYRELLRQTNDVQGAAVEAGNSQLAAFAKLQVATDNLAASIGKSLVPGLADIAKMMAGSGSDGLVTNLLRLQQIGESDGILRLIGLLDLMRPGGGQAFFQQVIAGRFAQPPEPPAGSGPVLGPEYPGNLRADQADAARQRKQAIKDDLDDRRDAAERRAQIEITAIEKEKQAVEKAYSARRAALENQKDAEIEAAEQARDGAIKAIEQQAQAAEDAYRRQVIAAEKARDGELKAAEDTRDGAIRSIEAQQEAAEAANDALIRQFEIERDRARQAAEDRRDDAIDALDAEKRAREDVRIAEDRARDDQQRETSRAIEQRHDAAIKALDAEAKAAEKAGDRKIRALDREADKAREASEKRIAAIDRAADREEERHRRVLDGLEEEEDARLRILDAQLKALDAQDDAADVAERMANLQDRLSKAQRGLAAATGTGTPQQIAEAREALTRALRIQGNDIGVANARELLDQLAGQGSQAIADAQKELSDVQADTQREQTKLAREGERDRLEAAKDAIGEEIAARKKAEDEENRSREREIAEDRDAEQKKLKNRLEALDKRKKAAQDATKDELDRIKTRVDAEKESHDLIVQQERDIAIEAKRATEDRRRAEDQADQDKRRQIATTYEEEQRQIKATYDDEETGVIPALKRAADAADREFKRQRDAAQARYEEEQAQIRATYDDPETGVIAKIKQQAEDAQREYAAAKTAINERYNDEKARIAEVYDDPEHGLFAKLAKAKQDTIDSLNEQVAKWQQWKTDTVKEISEALAKLDEFIKRVGDLDSISIGNQTPDGQGQVPGGIGPPIPRGNGGDLAYGPVVRNASPDSYWTSGGTHGGHPAADIFAPKGSPIYAPVGGRLSSYGDDKGGNAATMIGDDGRAYYFAHGNVPFVSGQVQRGDEIGQVGNTGNASGTSPHLHFAIASDAGLFGRLGGSGDIDGDSSYWGAGGTANARGAGDDEVEISILGRKIRVRSNAAVPGQVGQWIAEGLKLAGAPRDWQVPLGQIVAAESGERLGGGQVKLGTGNPRAENPTPVGERAEHAYGLPQFLPTTFAQYAVPPYNDIRNPVHQIATMARYVKGRYGSPWGTPYYSGGAFSYEGVEGYARGGKITEPTLLQGLNSGRLGIMGEAGPERILSAEQTRSWERGEGGGDSQTVIFNGLTYQEAEIRQRREQRRRQLLHGTRRLR